MKKELIGKLFPLLDRIFRSIDKKHIKRTRNIRLIPGIKYRRGGKLSYAEWAHVAGIFQTILYQNLENKTANNILDIGCGTGLLGISSEPFVAEGGSYTGLDVIKSSIAFCNRHFDLPDYSFIHFDVSNPTYASTQSSSLKPWPVEDESKDMVTALSVWTHLNEKDAIFYFQEIYRVLKKGGKAVVTFFYLDENYHLSLPKRSNESGRFHSTNQNRWIFEAKAYGSDNWYTPKWTKNPEDAIGITPEGLKILLNNSKLKLIKYYPGNWKESPGAFFQDILIFEK